MTFLLKGSARSGILGEATVNMTGYMSSPAPVPVSLRLKKCNHGTILQVSCTIVCYLFLGVCLDFAMLRIIRKKIRTFFLYLSDSFSPLLGEIFYVFVMITTSCSNFKPSSKFLDLAHFVITSYEANEGHYIT